MKIILACSECDYHEWGSGQTPLMNKIKMWNHVKRAHPEMANRIMRSYDKVPDHLFEERVPESA